MRSNTTFEKGLCERTGLFSLSKGQTDLFLLLQANTITYQQLALCKIHGNTEAAGRLSLKRLEKQGYVRSKKIPDTGAAKYYFLTTSGRSFLKQLFPGAFLEEMQANWERRPPGGIQQILHRIRTNDFYFTYIGSCLSRPLPWIIEAPLPDHGYPGQGMPPRCDGLLLSPGSKYYIEQDNSTQSESVILKKISLYQQSGLLSGRQPRNLLVFCLAFPRKQPPAVKPSFSLYRILLHFTRLWGLFEQEYQMPLDYQQFIQVLESSPIQKTVSANEMQALQTLRALHPDMDTLADADRLKKGYLNDSSYSELKDQEMDQLFLKRRRSHFRRIYENYPSLLAYALTGVPIFAVPNHRLCLYQPYIMPREYHLSDQLLKCLLFNGLNTDGWVYCCPLRVRVSGRPDFYFYQGVFHASYGYIAIEHLLIDLSARYRLIHYIKNCRRQEWPVFLILVSMDPEASEIRKQLDTASEYNSGNNTVLLQINANTSMYQDPPPQIFTSAPEKQAVRFECDEFDGKIRFIRKEAGYAGF